MHTITITRKNLSICLVKSNVTQHPCNTRKPKHGSNVGRVMKWIEMCRQRRAEQMASRFFWKRPALDNEFL